MLKNVLHFFSFLGVDIDCIALTLSGSASMPLLLKKNHNNFLDFTLNVHFNGFNYYWYFLHFSKSFVKVWIWSSSFLDLENILSINILIFLCIMSWKKVTIAHWQIAINFST